jgi:3-hydroxypropanoate dehydrogenase
MPQLSENAFDQVFRTARTYSRFTGQPVPDETLEQLYALLRWGPTAFNSQPARSPPWRRYPATRRTSAFPSPPGCARTRSAPVTAIVAQDTRFYEQLPQQFPARPDAGAPYAGNAALAQTTALRNSSLQGAYLIVAARMLGLDCGPMSGFDPAAVDAAFFPDGRWRSNFLVNLGYGDPESAAPRGPRLPFADAVSIQ